MIAPLLRKLFGTKHERDVKRLSPFVEEINGLEPEMQRLSDDALRKKALEFREQIAGGAELADLLPPVFALYLFLTQPDYIGPMFGDPIGWLMLGAGVVMLAVGAFWMSRLIKVEV